MIVLASYKWSFQGHQFLICKEERADLSRRAVMYNMQGLSFREFLQIETGQKFNYYKLEEIIERHESISVEILENIKPFQHFENYLKRGYYPFLFTRIGNISYQIS